jgi:hypothetical protein
MDGSAIIEYFAPLQEWLKTEQRQDLRLVITAGGHANPPLRVQGRVIGCVATGRAAGDEVVNHHDDGEYQQHVD